MIRVEDDGPGHRGDDSEPSSSRSGEASSPGRNGLGLAIARGFAKANGGRLWAEPRAGGAHARARRCPQPPRRARPGVSAQRVLVVDDEPQILRALRDEPARRRLRRRHGRDRPRRRSQRPPCAPPEAVILDLVLPDGSGTEVCRELRELERGADDRPLGGRRGEEKVAALDAGADDYVTKPFGIDELLARLRAALRRATPPAEPLLEIGELRVDLEKRVGDGRREAPCR